MENFKKFIKPFNSIKKSQPKDSMIPKYIKPDGTKVIEQESELGKVVYEISPDCTVICRTYNHSDKLILDWIRRTNLEIGRRYDEYQKIVYEFNSLYDEHNVLAKKTEIEYEYYDNGKKSKEIIVILPNEEKTEIFYDEEGKQTQKIVYKGSVKTWFDENNKPVKREIDRGSGGIIKEDL